MPGQGLQTVDGWTAGWRLEVIAVASPPGKSIYIYIYAEFRHWKFQSIEHGTVAEDAL